ncbi:MAG: hypothetical protein JSS09_09040 [Verrucomicrobia bacterium]|nr:hypothetical protein [Verrucomicrobiota bacterium]
MSFEHLIDNVRFWYDEKKERYNKQDLTQSAIENVSEQLRKLTPHTLPSRLEFAFSLPFKGETFQKIQSFEKYTVRFNEPVNGTITGTINILLNK